MIEISPVISCFRGHQGLSSHINGFLAVETCEIQSVWSSFANSFWFERCHQECDSRDSCCHNTCCSAIHPLPQAKYHRVWGRACGKFVKSNKIHYFMLLLCPSWLSTLLACLAPGILVLQLQFERYLGFFTVEITFQFKKTGCCNLKYSKFFNCNRNCLSDTVVIYIIFERISHNALW